MATVKEVTVSFKTDTKGLKKGSKAFNDLNKEVDKSSGLVRKTRREAEKLGKTIDRTTKKSGKSVSNLNSNLAKLGITIGAAFAIRALINFGKTLATTAVQMEAFERRAKVVFGEGIDIVREFAAENAKSLGLTENQFLGAAAAAGDLLVPLKFTRTRAAEMAVELTKLGGALKQFTGDQRSAAEISSLVARALTGEVESLKPLGVVISLQSKKFRDLAKSKIENEGVTQDQARALTIYQLALEQSGDALSSFEIDTDSLTRQQAVLEANLTEITETLATSFTPALFAASDALNKFFRILNSGKDGQVTFNEAWRDTRDVIDLGAKSLERLDFRLLEKEVADTEEVLSGLNRTLASSNKALETLENRTITIQGKTTKLIATEEDRQVILNSLTETQGDVAEQEELLIRLKEALIVSTQRATDEEKKLNAEETARMGTLAFLKKELSKKKEELDKSIINSKEFNGIQSEIIILEKRLKDALGKTKEATKKLTDEEKRRLALLKQLDETGKRNLKAEQGLAVLRQKESIDAATSFEDRVNKEIELAKMLALFKIENQNATAGEQKLIEAQLVTDINNIKKAGKEEEISFEEAAATELAQIRSAQFDNAVGLASALIGLAGQSAEAQKAALAFEKLAAIVSIITKVSAANAIIVAEGAALAIPTFGASVAAAATLVGANTTNAAIQIGIIGATAIPQFASIEPTVQKPSGFAEGTMDAPGGMAMVGEKGQEFMYVPSHAQILPNDKTSKYGEAISAMMTNKFDDFVVKDYMPNMILRPEVFGRSSGKTSKYDDLRLRGDVKNGNTILTGVYGQLVYLNNNIGNTKFRQRRGI